MTDKVKIYPGILKGDVLIPKSKSELHRVVICSALSLGKRFKNVIDRKNLSQDVEATVDSMTSIIEKKNIIYCRESGSTLRFLIPIVAALGMNMVFVLSGSLKNRPLNVYFDLLPQFGVNVKKCNDNILVSGKLKPGKFVVRGDISSQFVSGLMFALPLLKSESDIVISNVLESEPYVNLTVDVLSAFGITINKTRDGFHVPGKQKYVYSSYNVGGDWSQAAFFLSADALGSKVSVIGLDEMSKQGDKKIVDFLEAFGARKILTDVGMRFESNRLFGTELNLSQTPDLAPIISVVASLAEGETKLYGINRLRFKECDRLTAIMDSLKKFGVHVILEEDCLLIRGKSVLNGAYLQGYNDHRIVMAMAIAATRAMGPVTITDASSVNKSYPQFFRSTFFNKEDAYVVSDWEKY